MKIFQSTTTRPSLDTIAGLYAAACEQRAAAERAMARVLESARLHGYTEAEVSERAAVNAQSTEAETRVVR